MNRWLAKAILEESRLQKTEHIYYYELCKSEDDDEYRKFAMNGMALMYPVRIKGQEVNPKTGIGYHNTIKVFNRAADSADQAHEIASNTPLRPPSPKHVNIEPIILTGHTGMKIHVLALHGVHEPEAKEHNSRFEHMGFKQNYEFTPHISVDQDTWQRIKDEGHKTAHDAGISFGHAELRQGEKVLARYPHPDQAATTGAIQAVREKATFRPRNRVSKFNKSELLEKSLMRKLGMGAAALATVTSCALAPNDHAPNAGSHKIEATNHVDKYDHQKMLDAIASVESSGGKNLNHKPTSQGTAYGKYALMPNTIRDTIHLNRDLASHKKALAYDNTALTNYMNENPGLEQELAEHHLKRLEQHFGPNRDAVGFAWNQGVSGTHRAIKDKKEISNHPYVEKIREAYRGKS